MSAVGEFLRTNDRPGFETSKARSVTDLSGNARLFETRPNALYRIVSAHDQSFEHIYRIVI